MTAPGVAMTFADWQFSRGIVPWSVVHDFDEHAYRLELFKQAVARRVARLVEVVRSAVETIVAALAPVVRQAIDAFRNVADAFAPFLESPDS